MTNPGFNAKVTYEQRTKADPPKFLTAIALCDDAPERTGNEKGFVGFETVWEPFQKEAEYKTPKRP